MTLDSFLSLLPCLLTLPLFFAMGASGSSLDPSPPSPPNHSWEIVDSPPSHLSPDPPLPARKPRGAPPGNLNALKHGYYARSLSARTLRRQQHRSLQPAGELAQASASPQVASLQAEIDMFRLIVRHVALRCRQIDDLDQELRYVSVLSHSLATLSRLVKTQQLLASGEVDQVIAQMELVIAELTSEHSPSQPLMELPPEPN